METNTKMQIPYLEEPCLKQQSRYCLRLEGKEEATSIKEICQEVLLAINVKQDLLD